MARIEKTVFISYRRTDVYTALAVYENLKNQGYDVFFDYRSISSGDFEQIITSNIRARAHFLIILTPTALDRLDEPGDWLRREVEIAIEQKRNIVPLFFKGFSFGILSVSEKLTGKLKNLSHYNGLNVHEDYFEEAMQRVRTQFLNIPLDTVLHPVSTEVQKVVKEEQVAADEALKQRDDIKDLARQAEETQDGLKAEPAPVGRPQNSNHQLPDVIDNEFLGNDTFQNETSKLLEELIVEYYKKYKLNGYSDDFLSRGLNWAVEITGDVIRKMAIPVDTLEQVANIATNSVSDKEIGELVADSLDKVGKDGFITVEESRNPYFEVEYKEGMCFDSGYLSSYFVTDVDEMKAVLVEPYIIIHDGKLSTTHAIIHLIEKLIKTGTRELVIIANDIYGEALDALTSYKLHGTLNVLAVKAPDFGQYSEAILYDIAALTGCNVLSDKNANKLEIATLQDLGRAEKVVSDKENTTIIGGKGKHGDINRRIREINAEIDRGANDYDRMLLRKRLAKLSGGEATIRVGAAIRAEAKAKKHRVQTALSAALAAIEEGIVPGNGVTYLHCKKTLAGINANYDYERVGQLILCDVLDAPIRKVANGLGLDPNMVIEQIAKKPKGKRNTLMGLDIKTGKFGDLAKIGVIEPAGEVIHTISHAVDSAIARATSTG